MSCCILNTLQDGGFRFLSGNEVCDGWERTERDQGVG